MLNGVSFAAFRACPEWSAGGHLLSMVARAGHDCGVFLTRKGIHAVKHPRRRTRVSAFAALRSGVRSSVKKTQDPLPDRDDHRRLAVEPGSARPEHRA